MKWASCLPKWGNVLAHHGQRACPCWADLLSDICPISSYCNTHIPVSWILPTQAIPVVWIPHTWEFFSPDNSFHQQTIQTIAWQSKDSQLPVGQNIATKNQTIWQFSKNSWFYKESALWATFFNHIDQHQIIKGLDNRRVSASPIIQSLFYVQTRGLNGMFLNVTSRASYRSSHRCQGEDRWLTYPCSDRR